MEDVNAQMREEFPFARTPMINFLDLEFADDTVLVARADYIAQRTLRLLEDTAAYYGLRLNYDKTYVLSLHSERRISFRNGEL
eukprot:4924380-Alexandrium_andersonii.AAC.1